MHIGQTVGPFEIEKELGSGAMGTVYRAVLKRAGKPDKVVALKVIAFGLTSNESALKRFEREAQILQQLRHPNIVRLVNSGRYKNTPFFAMEYVEGRSMDRITADRQAGIPGKAPFTWEEVVEFGRPLCDALQHAHDKGIIHRDLKPSNLMLTNEGILKLTDFGIAKDIDVTALTGQNNTIGTAAYMSPEQCKGEKHLTGKSDIYSLGVVFYELLTGRKPFQAESSVDMFLAHVSESFIRPGQINPTIPVWLDTLVCQMMEKKPEHRPRDAAMVGQVLAEIAEKVASAASAGADVATARGGPTRVDAEDRHAAQFIRAGAKKKKLRKRKVPFYTKGWFVGLAVLLVAGSIFGIVKMALAPPSAEVLLGQIESAPDGERKQAAVAEYLKHYGDRTDEKTERVRTLDRDLKVAERERVLLNRHRNERLRARAEEDDDPDAYKKTMAALTAENEGDTNGAQYTWKELVEVYAKQGDGAKALWGWHAQKKLNDLAATARTVDEIVKRLEDSRRDDKDVRLDELDRQVSIPVRLERLGDFALAHTRWAQLVDNLKGESERRPLVVYARGRGRELEGKRSAPKDATERATLLNRKIVEAKTLLAGEEYAQKRDGRFILREIRDLYPGETGEVGKVVEEAKRLLGG
jgi:eukaryotic-like serine/threonine-protein kinase